VRPSFHLRSQLIRPLISSALCNLRIFYIYQLRLVGERERATVLAGAAQLPNVEADDDLAAAAAEEAAKAEEEAELAALVEEEGDEAVVVDIVGPAAANFEAAVEHGVPEEPDDQPPPGEPESRAAKRRARKEAAEAQADAIIAEKNFSQSVRLQLVRYLLQTRAQRRLCISHDSSAPIAVPCDMDTLRGCASVAAWLWDHGRSRGPF